MPDPADTKSDATTWRDVAGATGAPDFLLPWLDRFYDEDDAELVRLAVERPQALADLPAARLRRAVGRAVLDTVPPPAGGETASPGGVDYRVASFHARFDVWACFEGWRDLPANVRRELCEWELADYVDRVRAGVGAVREGTTAAGGEADYAYLLLEEAEALVREAGRIYLWPCDCRSMWGSCELPRQVCLRFEDDRGRGTEIDATEAVRVLRAADAAGLMRTAYAGRSAADTGAVCCCCRDCCFPHLAAARLHAEDVWPRRRYLAVIDEDECTACGLCVERCPFDALAQGDDPPVVVDAHRCRGCGVCSTGCPSEAIRMSPRPRAALPAAGR
jgi:Pyruvate/2-oxoacid:ferredoxin oxidoreductase delta subunit